MLFGLLAQNLIFVSLAVFCWRCQRASPAEIGTAWPTRRHILLGLVLGLVLWSAAYGAGGLLQLALQAILSRERYTELVKFHNAHTAVRGFVMMGPSLWARLAFVLVGSIAAPIGEEALFRGLIYRAMRARWGVKTAIVGSALIFALVHVSPLAMGVIFLIGVLLAWAYEETGSLWVPILMHSVNNALMFALLWQHVK